MLSRALPLIVILASPCATTTAVGQRREPIAVNFRSGIPAGWTIGNGELGNQVLETSDGLVFPPQPPNLPKGSIVSPTFVTAQGEAWTISVTTKGTGSGGATFVWLDGAGKPITSTIAVQAPSEAFAAQSETVTAPAGSTTAFVWYGVDTFGWRTLAEMNISSTQGN